MSQDDLLAFLFADLSQPLTAQMTAWLSSSRRFKVFVVAFRTKIRKKLRGARDPESVRDLRLELETAYLLLTEKSLSLTYEPQIDTGTRSPDFAVTSASGTLFMVEVTRLRSAAHQASPTILWNEPFTGTVCRKLGQLLPQCGNLVLVEVEPRPPPPRDLSDALLGLQQRAEGADEAVLERYGFGSRSDFFRHYQRLSAVLVRGPTLEAGDGALWLNPQAKRPLPSKVRTVLARSHKLQFKP